MAKLIWGTFGERYYEGGVDRGVLYLPDSDGVPWNGLTSVRESSTGGEVKPYYIDGFKYLNLSTESEFRATIEAFTYPDEFAECDGTAEVAPGAFATQQRRMPFSFSYRTKVGNDLEGFEHGYKIHLVYNATADPSNVNYDSLSGSSSPATFSWQLSTRAAFIPGRRPVSHLVIDSRKIDPTVLSIIEGYIYGSEGIPPRLPSIAKVISWLSQMDDPVFTRPWNNLDIPTRFKGVMPKVTRRISNRFKNPRGANTEMTTTVRANLARYPTARIGFSMWANDKPAAAQNISIGANIPGLPSLTSFFRGITTTTHTTLGEVGPYHSSMSTDIVAGKTYTVSAYGRASRPQTTSRLHVRWFDASGNQLREDRSTQSLHDSNVWLRRHVTVVAPENAVRLWISYWWHGAPGTGDTYDMTGILVEETGELRPYFDGYSSPDTDLTPSWTGFANSSSSELTAPKPVGLTAYNGLKLYYSKKYDMMVAVTAGSKLPEYVNGTAKIIMVEEGETVTSLIDAWSDDEDRLPAGITSQVHYATATTNYYFDENGEIFERVSGTATRNTSSYYVIDLSNRALEGATVRFRVGVITGEYNDLYFDGDSEGFVYEGQVVSPGWLGTSNDSESYFDIIENFPEKSAVGDIWLIEGDLWMLRADAWLNLGVMPSLV